jgi:hypothetical protein
MEKEKELEEVIEKELEELEQFIFDDQQLSYYSEYNQLYLSNY